MTTITDIKPIDFNDKAAIAKEIDDFCKKYAYANIEHALEISPNGNVYSLTGTKYSVNSEVIGEEALRGSISIHNHPVPKNENMGDSFSLDDLLFAAENNLGKQYLVSGERRDFFRFTEKYTETDVYNAYVNAEKAMNFRAEIGIINIYWRQEEIIKILNEFLKGFEFYNGF